MAERAIEPAITNAVDRFGMRAPLAWPKEASLKLLGASRKTEKGIARGVATAVLYMSPSVESGVNLCPMSTPECAQACLGHGAGHMTHNQNSRLWKSCLYKGNRALWLKLLRAELVSFARQARRHGLRPAVRLDGSTDMGEARRLAPAFPKVQFYDYTKVEGRYAKYLGRKPKNLNLTFSFSGGNLDYALWALARGGHVAVVFETNSRLCEPLPATWRGYKVIDGDRTDVRFKDPKGAVVVGLRFKKVEGRLAAIRAAGAFVQPQGPTQQFSGPFRTQALAREAQKKLRRRRKNSVDEIRRRPGMLGWWVPYWQQEGAFLPRPRKNPESLPIAAGWWSP